MEDVWYLTHGGGVAPYHGGGVALTSLHKAHPGLRTTIMTAPFFPQRSAPFSTSPLPSSFFSLAAASRERSYGSCLGLGNERGREWKNHTYCQTRDAYSISEELATRKAAPRAAAADPTTFNHISAQRQSFWVMSD